MSTAETSLPAWVPFKRTVLHAGEFSLFFFRFLRELFKLPFEGREFLFQCYRVGNKSLPLVGVTSFIMGLVLTLQTRPSLATFGAVSLLPGMVSVSVIKEIGPVITAIICAGKISSRMGAELGSMKVTEQIDAMEVSAINPFRYLVVTRVLATTFMVPLLVVFADCISLLSSFLAYNIHDNISIGRFFNMAISKLDWIDIFPSLIKSVLFGTTIGIIGCYKGFRVDGGTASVGTAANSAVVTASLAIFFIDLIVVQITDIL
ncbi:MAG TPA: ABC transporter permease [Puia sp.]|jgi:phospholipid/cholesterol/gamma-HCH transport system permease protein